MSSRNEGRGAARPGTSERAPVPASGLTRRRRCRSAATMSGMAQPAVAPRAPLWAVALTVLGLATVPLSLLGVLLIDHQLVEVGRSDLRILEPSAAWYVFDAVV